MGTGDWVKGYKYESERLTDNKKKTLQKGYLVIRNEAGEQSYRKGRFVWELVTGERGEGYYFF